MRSVLFFDGFILTWVYRNNLAWLPERQLWGTLLICIIQDDRHGQGVECNFLTTQRRMTCDTSFPYKFVMRNRFLRSVL